jgi:protein phosphatase
VTALNWGVATDVGQVRTNNEDTSLIGDDLFVVADGMGGHRAGEVASQVAAAAVRAHFADRTVDGLRAAVEEANREVFEQQANDPDLEGMGTTLVAIALIDDGNGPGQELAFANVGDSRIYRFRDGALEQISADHTLVDEMVRDGRLSAEEARVHPRRHIVTRALGIDRSVDVDVGEVEPFRGDRFVLCSDGLTDEVDDSRIASVLRRLADPTEAANELVRVALESGGRDNVTVVVVDVTDDDDKALAASAALARDPSGTKAHTDLAGFTAAPAEPSVTKATTPAKKTKEPKPRAKRLTWRVPVFLLALVVVLGAAAGAVGWYGRHTYYVGFSGDQVAIFKGKPGGVLWIDPTLQATTGIQRADVPKEFLARITKGVEEATLKDAAAFVDNVRKAAAPTTTTTTTTSTTTSATTTTTTAATTSTVP